MIVVLQFALTVYNKWQEINYECKYILDVGLDS